MLHVKTEKFEGPLALLLKLIEGEELDITEISLAKIADQYIEQLKLMTNLNPEEMADFLLVASKLLLIKSKALLPYLFPEEEQEIEDFEQQLKIYKEFLDASKKISSLLGKKKFMFIREFNRKAVLAEIKLFAPPKSITGDILAGIYSTLIGNLVLEQVLEEKKIEQTFHIGDKIIEIEQILINKIKFKFSRVLSQAGTKTEVIVSFLALLELIKQKTVVVAQEELFSDIEVSKNSFTS